MPPKPKDVTRGQAAELLQRRRQRRKRKTVEELIAWCQEREAAFQRRVKEGKHILRGGKQS